jgi:hypothetical protein
MFIGLFSKATSGQYIDRSEASGQHYTFSLENYFSSLDISIIGIAASIFLYCLMGILDKSFHWGDVAYFITFTIASRAWLPGVLLLPLLSVLYVRQQPNFSAHCQLVWDQRMRI